MLTNVKKNSTQLLDVVMMNTRLFNLWQPHTKVEVDEKISLSTYEHVTMSYFLIDTPYCI